MSRKKMHTRREMLVKTAGAASAAAAFALAASTAAKADGGGMSPDSVGYVTHPNGGHQCSNCSLYIPGSPATANGTCKAVSGSISPTAWCQIWSPLS